MKFVKLLLSLATTIALIWSLNNSFSTGNANIPALGSLLNPFSGFWQNAEPNNAISPSDMTGAALKGVVQVTYDERLVPHIFAEHTDDALFVQGYLHAKHRLFQMDFLTRATSGRLSEIFGEASPSVNYLRFDKVQRRQGKTLAAETFLAGIKKDPELERSLQRYVDGVNMYITHLQPKDYPLEFKILGYKPEAWTMLKSTLFMVFMADDLASHNNDLEATNAKLLLGADFQTLFPLYFNEQSPIVPKGTAWNFKTLSTTPPLSNANLQGATSSLLTPIGFDSDWLGEKPDPSNGSNNWAVAPSKTKNGHAILCGDPHLSLRLPAIWFEIQIKTPEFNTYGVSFPGMPLVPIGFNNDISWTPTNVGHDVSDWYSINWKNTERTEYELDGKIEKAKMRVETFQIKGKTYHDTIRMTKWGPVVFDDTTGWRGLARHWLGHEAPALNAFKTLLGFAKAKNHADFVEATKHWVIPAQNYIMASRSGDVALKITGALPIKSREQGRFVSDGSKSENAWKGFIPSEQNPQYKNPSRGFVSSANQHSTDPSYPYPYHSEGFDQFRGRIVNNKLEKMTNITVEDMMLLQNDNSSLQAAESLPLMLKNVNEKVLSDNEKILLGELKTWDYEFSGSKRAPALYSMWFDSLYRFTWDEILTLPNHKEVLKPSVFALIRLLRGEINAKFFDIKATPATETASEIVTQAFQKMASEYDKQKAKTLNFDWAALKDTKIPHLLPPMKSFGRTNIRNNGHRNSINSMKESHGPSWRMIVEMADKPRAWVVYPGGQSGNPGSKYYDNFIDTWAQGKYYEALFLQDANENAKGILFKQKFSK